MSNITTIKPVDPKAIEAVLVKGDVSALSTEQRLGLINNLCEMIGINPLTRPFDFMQTRDRKEILYANKGCAEQLRSVHKISVKIVDRQKFDDVFVVTAEASNPEGRVDSSTGAVSLVGLKGEALANAMMKAETKAKRRVTLSICGLNMLDETEVETIPGAQKVQEKEVEAKPVENPLDSEKFNKDPGSFVPSVGKYQGQELRSINVSQLENYLSWLKNNQRQTKKPFSAAWKEMVEFSELYLLNLENLAAEEIEAEEERRLNG